MDILTQDTIAQLNKLRSLAFKHERRDEWTPEDQAEFEFYCKLVQLEYHLSFDYPLDSEQIFDEVIKKVGQAIADKVAPANILDPEVVARYDDYLAKAKEQVSRKTGAQAFVSRVQQQFGVSEATATILAAAVAQVAWYDSEEALQQAKTAIDELAPAQTDPQTKGLILATLHPDLQTNSSYAATNIIVADQLEVDPSSTVAALATTKAFLGPNDEIDLQELTAMAEAELTSQLGASRAQQEIKTYNEKRPQISEILGTIKPLVAKSRDLKNALVKDTALEPNKDPQAWKQAQQVFEVAAFIPYLAAKGKEEISDPKQLEEYEQLLKALAVKYAESQGVQVDDITKQLIMQARLRNFFDTAYSVETTPKDPVMNYISSVGVLMSPPPQNREDDLPKTTPRINRLPWMPGEYKNKANQIKGFMADVYFLSNNLSFDQLVKISNKYDLGKIDASLDKYFKNPDLLNYARAENFAGNLIGDVVPGAKPLTNLLTAINKAGLLIIDRSPIGEGLRFIQKKIREGVWKNFVAGALVGIPIALGFGLVVGVPAAIAAGYFYNGANLAKLPAQIGTAVTGIANAAISGFIGVLTVVFVVMLTIPILVTFMLFIINSGAFIVPANKDPLSGSNTYYNTSTALTLGPGGTLGCWPASGPITQGPPGSTTCNGICSHVFYNEQAVDIGIGVGTPVYAANDGLATSYTGPGSLFGNYVKIVSTDSKFITLYAHLSQVTFSTPTVVTAGTLIGYSGNTGNSIGPHLHYEIFDGSGGHTISINSVVPTYTVGGFTTGQLCKDGGKKVTPTSGSGNVRL